MAIIATNSVHIARFANALYATQLGSITNASVQSDITAAGGLDNALNAYYAYSFGSMTTAQVAGTLLTNLGLVAGKNGLTQAAVDNASLYIVGVLNAAVPNARGAAVKALLNQWANISDDANLSATYGAAAAVWNGQVTTAQAYTLSNATDIGVNEGSAIGKAFALTTGADTFNGGTANDTFNASETTGNTWTVGDAIDGGDGTDTFNIIQTAAITAPVGATVKNIETANLLSGATATSLNTTTWTGLTALNATAPGAVTLTGAATTDITVTDATQAAGAIAVNGGKAVTITASTSVANGATGGNVTVGATTAAAGAVSITENVASSNITAGTATGGAITVTGGTTVTVNQNISGASVATANVTANAVGGLVTVTGNASTTTVTVNQTAAVTAVASATAGKHGIKAGAVDIKDTNAQSTTAAGTIATASLKNYGDSTIDSNALTTVNLEGTGGTVGITTNSLTTAANTALALNVNGLSYKNATAGTNAITVDSDVKTLNITSSSAASTVANITASGATAVNVAGDAALTLTDNTFVAATAITVTNTAGATFGTAAIAAGTLFTGGAGADAIILSNSFTKAITMGSGNDTVTVGGTSIGSGGSVNAGDGTDTVKMTTAQAATFDNDSTFNSKYTGFEVLELSDALTGDVTLDLAGLNAATKVVLDAGGAVAATSILSGMASGGTVETLAGSPGFTVNVANALFNAADTLNLSVKSSTAATTALITAAGVETVNISVADAATAGSAAVKHVITALTLADATTVNVSGNNGLTITAATGSTKVTTFDASGVVANATADTTANLAVTYASLNSTASATVTIKGGAGDDVLTGNAAKDNINGGAGADVVSGGLGQDTVTVGSGRDVVKVASDVNNAFSDSTTAAADVVNGFTLTSAATAATAFADVAAFQASTANGANLSMLDIDLTAAAAANLPVAIEADATGAGQAAGVSYTVTKGLLTLSGSGASTVDTLGEWLTEAAAVSATDGETIAFVFGSDTYVFAQNAGQDVLVQLVGVSASSLIAAGTGTASAGAIIIGDSL